MPEPNQADQLQALRDLLREGRVNEADRQLDEMSEKLRQEAERIKRETPPPSPRTAAELLGALLSEVVHFLGNQPRMTALVEEYSAQVKKAE